MNKDVPVAELNFLSVRLGKFSWDLSPLEVESTSRKHRNKGPPECHIRLGARRNNAVPLASKSGGVSPVSMPADRCLVARGSRGTLGSVSGQVVGRKW